jgi:hypothetical protein
VEFSEQSDEPSGPVEGRQLSEQLLPFEERMQKICHVAAIPTIQQTVNRNENNQVRNIGQAASGETAVNCEDLRAVR